VLLLRAEPHVLHHRPRESLGERSQQLRVVAQAHRHRARERQDPLSVTHRRQHVVHQQRSALDHPPAHARRAKSARLAGEGHPQLVAAGAAAGPHEAELEVSRRSTWTSEGTASTGPPLISGGELTFGSGVVRDAAGASTAMQSAASMQCFNGSAADQRRRDTR